MREILPIVFTFCMFIFSKLSAQTIIQGIVQSEDGVPLNKVLVINMKTEEKSTTNPNGFFSISANEGDEIRWVRIGFERERIIVSEKHFNTSNIISLKPIYQQIEEVKILPFTGNLTKDSKILNESKPIAERKQELLYYIKRNKSTLGLNWKSKEKGEFLQPKGKGFSIGSPNNKWTRIQLVEFLISTIDESFFTDDLQLQKQEISPFVVFSIQDFQGLYPILKYGNCSEKDLLAYIEHAYKKIIQYRKNITSQP